MRGKYMKPEEEARLKTNWVNDPKNQPDSYKNAAKLVKNIQDVLNTSESGGIYIKPETKNAAKALVSQLEESMSKWRAHTIDALEIREKKGVFTQEVSIITPSSTSKAWLEANLVTDCSKAINSNKSMLTKDPGFWEQVKESINNFLGVKAFNVKETAFGENKEIESLISIKPE